MKVFTTTQIKRWDAYTIRQESIASIDLMERAAAACFHQVTHQLKYLLPTTQEGKHNPILIFCGMGNNGGDGLAIARMLLQKHHDVTVYIAGTHERGSIDFEKNLEALSSLTSHIHFIKEATPLPVIDKNNLVVDALFGTGLNKPIEGFVANLVQHINQSGATVISIDLPSGMFADKSSSGMPVIKASHTLSFEVFKLCFLMPENESYVGELHLLDIGLSKDFYATEPAAFVVSEPCMMKAIFRPRRKFAHKGNFGHALLVAGSYGKMGAAQLAARACLKTGVGLLTVHVPESGNSILQAMVPEAMTLTGEVVPANTYACIGIGPGLGTDEPATLLLSHVITNLQALTTDKPVPATICKLVIDADALNILAANKSLLAALPGQTILTPHPKEFERLFGKCSNDFERITLALQKASDLDCYIVLKGHHSFIATPTGEGYFNNTGNAGMAKGGSGDVLTGMLTSLAAQGYSPLQTCLLGVYLHGLAGDLAAEKFSQEAMTATDIIEQTGQAFKKF
jgi:ADP-dependent NAD(P)H-hydrate dehydratase / NAD(P)H-hydrate epimerase